MNSLVLPSRIVSYLDKKLINMGVLLAKVPRLMLRLSICHVVLKEPCQDTCEVSQMRTVAQPTYLDRGHLDPGNKEGIRRGLVVTMPGSQA